MGVGERDCPCFRFEPFVLDQVSIGLAGCFGTGEGTILALTTEKFRSEHACRGGFNRPVGDQNRPRARVEKSTTQSGDRLGVTAVGGPSGPFLIRACS